MKKSWIDFLSKIKKHTDHIENPFYRGHSDESWKLVPSLFRNNVLAHYENPEELEQIIYYDFIANAGKLLNSTKKSWEILYLMRHHSFPTRLLDWSENFAIALYFAINEPTLNKPEIWVLDPYDLNASNSDEKMNLMNPEHDFEYDYYNGFIVKKAKTFKHPKAIYPGRNSDRIFNQRGTFTIQGSESKSIEELCPSAVKRFKIPEDALKDCENFLNLAGVNEYSIFSDLDSLARHLKKIHKY